MAKWKCEICGNEFENFHAQGFDNKIYCPLCYFKKENQELKKKLEERTKMYQNAYKYGQRMEDVTITLKAEQKEFIKYLEDMLDDENDIFSVVRVKDILSKYKEIAGE